MAPVLPALFVHSVGAAASLESALTFTEMTGLVHMLHLAHKDLPDSMCRPSSSTCMNYLQKSTVMLDTLLPVMQELLLGIGGNTRKENLPPQTQLPASLPGPGALHREAS